MDREIRINKELVQAEAARLAGKEGKARVCARRAAGIAAREYMIRQGIIPADPSAYALLRHLKSLPGLSPRAYQAVDHLLLRVTADFTLPVDVDLIAEARFLAQDLLS